MSRPTALRNLRLSELSLVKDGANQGARVTLMKRADGAATETGPDGGAGTARKGALRTEEHSMTDANTVAALQTQVADLTKALTTANTDLAKAKADLDAATAIVKAAQDEAITVGGVELKKSVVGEGTFLVLKAQAAEVAKAKEDAEIVTLTKRAETEFANIPGEPVAKAKALKALSGLPEAERATIEAALKAGDAALKSGTTEVGKGGQGKLEGGATATDKLDALAKSRAESGKVSFAKAYSEVLETPEGRELYSQSLNGG